MAITINVADKKEIARQDTFIVPPSDIIRGQNSRVIQAANYKDCVTARAVSIATEGQLQPAEARRDADKRLVLTLGFTRLDAVELLREGFEHDGVKYHDPDAKLWVKVVDCSPEEAFIRGIVENNDRNDVTDLQEAKAHEYLRTVLGKTDTEISKIYGYTNLNRTMALRKLVSLDGKTQQLVHEGKLSLHAALLTKDLTEEQRAAIIDGATDSKGRVAGNVVKELLRHNAEVETDTEPTGEGEGDDAEPAAPKAKSLKRSTKDVQNWIAEQIASTDDEDADGPVTCAQVAFLNHLSGWLDGKAKFSTKKLNELFAELS